MTQDKFMEMNFPKDVRDTLQKVLTESVYCTHIPVKDGNAFLSVEDGAYYRRTLILKKVSGIPSGTFDYLAFYEDSLEKEGDCYKLKGEYEDFHTEESSSFTISFCEAEVSIQTFRSDAPLFEETPWLILQSMATGILDKCFLPGDYLNEKEKECLPLIAEISKLTYWAVIPEEYNNSSFPLLTSLFKEHGCNKIVAILEKLETVYEEERKRAPLIQKFTNQINQGKYEFLWRELYEKLWETGTSYPEKADFYPEQNQLENLRIDIQAMMESHGYLGTYPDFVKEGSFRGFHVAESYDFSYFIGPTKRAVYHVHCSENFFNEGFRVEFICGTELLRKGEEKGDIFSCHFNDNAHHLLHHVSYEGDFVNDEGEWESQDLATRVQVAVKLTELMKLTKKEKEEIGYLDIPGFKIFLSVFLLMGGMYGICMTVAFMLIGVISCLLVGQPETIPALFTDMPWWILLAIAWVGFGGAMGVVTVLAKKGY